MKRHVPQRFGDGFPLGSTIVKLLFPIAMPPFELELLLQAQRASEHSALFFGWRTQPKMTDDA
jgi:hypothetical protein